MPSIDEHSRSPGRREYNRKFDEPDPPTLASSSRLDGNLGLAVDAAPSVLIGSGVPLPPHRGNMNHVFGPPLVPDLYKRTLQRLVSRAAPKDELPSLIETVVSNMRAADIVELLQGSDVQTFIDVVDEVLCPSHPDGWVC